MKGGKTPKPGDNKIHGSMNEAPKGKAKGSGKASYERMKKTRPANFK